jgi:hypothetical protein
MLTAADSAIESSDAIVEVLLSVCGTGIVGRHIEYPEGIFRLLLYERLQLFWKYEELRAV